MINKLHRTKNPKSTQELVHGQLEEKVEAAENEKKVDPLTAQFCPNNEAAAYIDVAN